MVEMKKENLKQISSILRETKEIGTLSERLKLIGLYLNSANKDNVYSLIMDISENNLVLEEQNKLIYKYLKNGEDTTISSLVSDYFPQNNISDINKIVDVYNESYFKEMIYELLSDPGMILFRKIDEIVKFAKLYEDVMKTEDFLAYIRNKQNLGKISKEVYNILTDLNYLTNPNCNYEMLKQIVCDYLEKNDIYIINFEPLEKQKTK